MAQDPTLKSGQQANSPNLPAALDALASAMQGRSAPLEFLPSSEPGDGLRWVLRPDVQTGEQIAVVVRTSGSTGVPKQTLLSAAALHASAELSAAAVGGHGQWLLTLEPSYVAGLSVLNRSLAADTTPVVLLKNTTDPQVFAEAAAQLEHPQRYVSLVPTQLHQLLASGDPDALRALQRFDTILLGGAQVSDALRSQAASTGLHIRTTYGMSETCGGCVYDGYSFPGVSVKIDDDARVLLSGPILASGYFNDQARTAAAFITDASGQRWYRTDDLGRLSAPAANTPAQHKEGSQPTTSSQHSEIGQPKLDILSRADDVITTGGVKVSAESVRSHLLKNPEVADAFVAGIPDERWGQMVAALILWATEPAGSPERLAEEIRTRLGPVAAPKRYVSVDQLPQLRHGKIDRQTCLELLTQGSTDSGKDSGG